MSVKIVVRQSKEKKKVVQPAEAKTRKADSSVVVAEDVSKEQAETPDVPAIPFDLSQVDPKKIALAEEMGIPITQLINWAASVEARFAIIQKDIAAAPEEVVKALKAEALKGQVAAGQRGSPEGSTDQKRGGDLGAILQLLSAGGGSQNSMMEMYQKEILQAGLESARMGTAFQKALVIKLVPSFANDILKGISNVPKKE